MGRRNADMKVVSPIYITRSDIGWYSCNANAYRKPLEVVSRGNATLCVDRRCRVPQEIADKASGIVRFDGLLGLLGLDVSFEGTDVEVFTGFDFPCMFKAWKLKRKLGCRWTVFLWDPPCLSYRDAFPPIRWTVDALFRFFAKRCDRLVLNIHPGLLNEIGYVPRDGQLELRMQDAFEGVDFNCGKEDVDSEWDFGVLANWSKAKGGDLVERALRALPGRRCLWIGESPDNRQRRQIEFAGHLPQEEAFAKLRKCRVLVVPYLPTRALKWNYPLKLFEYLSIGRPIIASDNPGNVSVANRYTGRITLFKSGDADDMVAKARDLIGPDS